VGVIMTANENLDFPAWRFVQGVGGGVTAWAARNYYAPATGPGFARVRSPLAFGGGPPPPHGAAAAAKQRLPHAEGFPLVTLALVRRAAGARGVRACAPSSPPPS